MDTGTPEVYITHIDSPGKFFVVHASKLDTLDAIWQELEKEIETKILNPPDFLNPIMPCVACWNGRWYRGRVISRRPDGKAEIEYVDYGNIETVELQFIKKRPLNALVNMTEPLALPCRLSGDNSRMDKTKMEEICTAADNNFKMKIDDVDDETGQYVVTLIEERRKWNVNQMIEISEASPFAHSQLGAQVAVVPRQYAHIGPMGGRMKNIRDRGARNIGSGESEEQENPYPLVDLSEDPPAPQQKVQPNLAGDSLTSGPLRTFVSDLDAYLDGCGYDSDSDDEDEGTPCASAAKGGISVGRGSASGITRGNADRSWSASSESAQSLSAEDECLKALKEKWSHVLSSRYGNLKAPAPGSLSAEQQVMITNIISPTAFYAQTVQQNESLKRLELSMADECRPGQNAIPAPLIAPGLCCAVYNETMGTWRRAQVVRVDRDVVAGIPQQVADVFLVDTGFERRFPVTAIKPINEHFTAYLPLSFCVKLAHPYFENIQWRPEDTEAFRQMVEKRMLILKFMTNTPPIFEVEMVDMMHTCNACATRVKKCTVNERMFQWIQGHGGLGNRM